MTDSHVVKMVLESAQMLSTAHRVLDGDKDRKLADEREDVLYKASYINHPCNVWCRESVENYNWLSDHYRCLLAEYTHRYGKKHATGLKINWHVTSPPFNLRAFNFTSPALAMPDEFKVEDPVESYRNYYRNAKAHLHKWKNRDKPDWI